MQRNTYEPRNLDEMAIVMRWGAEGRTLLSAILALGDSWAYPTAAGLVIVRDSTGEEREFGSPQAAHQWILIDTL
jgi:hypothetical protein